MDEEIRERIALEIEKGARELRKRRGVEEEGLKIVVAGKGGVGKSTIAAAISLKLAEKGYKVLAVDADPQASLPRILGIKKEFTPLSKQIDYIEEKTGARPGESWGIFFRMNPDVSDVIERFAMVGPRDIKVLVVGSVTSPATGCLCPEFHLLRAVISLLSLEKDEVVVMDTQAGLEHFGRAIAQGFRHSIIITEQNMSSADVAVEALTLSHDLKIPNLFLVLNKIRDRERALAIALYVKESIPFELSGVSYLPYVEALEKEEDIERVMRGEFDEGITSLLDFILGTT